MRKIILVLLIFYPLLGYCQMEDHIWLTGDAVVFTSEFKNDTVFNSIYIDSVWGWGIRYAHGNTDVCSKEGKLLCGSDGMNVYNRTHHFMDGGYKLVPDVIYNKYTFSPWSQTSIMLPFDSKIYLFTVTASDERFTRWKDETISPDSSCFDLLTYHIIDMKANGGLGKVVESKIPLIQDDLLQTTEMMACRHANGRDWWLLKGFHQKIAYQLFLVTEQGITNYGRQDFIWYGEGEDYNYDGQCTFSSDGTLFATVKGHRGTINIFDFDRCTGKLSNQRFVNVPHLTIGNPNDTSELEFMRTVGIAFSPNNEYVYVSGKFTIQQYDLNNLAGDSAWFTVAKADTTLDFFQGYSNLYLGPNNKIYIGNWDGLGGEMSVINNPNGKGINSGWCRKCMRFPNQIWGGATTPPCMPNYRLGALKGSACDTIGKIYLEEMVVFPNPVNDQLIVSLPLNMNTEFQYQVFDMVGNKVSEEKSTLNSKSQFTIDVREIATGMYVLRVTSSYTDFVTKFVKR